MAPRGRGHGARVVFAGPEPACGAFGARYPYLNRGFSDAAQYLFHSSDGERFHAHELFGGDGGNGAGTEENENANLDGVIFNRCDSDHWLENETTGLFEGLVDHIHVSGHIWKALPSSQ